MSCDCCDASVILWSQSCSHGTKQKLNRFKCHNLIMHFVFQSTECLRSSTVQSSGILCSELKCFGIKGSSLYSSKKKKKCISSSSVVFVTLFFRHGNARVCVCACMNSQFILTLFIWAVNFSPFANWSRNFKSLLQSSCFFCCCCFFKATQSQTLRQKEVDTKLLPARQNLWRDLWWLVKWNISSIVAITLL